ncbi:MAG: type II toxin-antitoxin system HicA family toxin [Anaerolineales bacterium]
MPKLPVLRPREVTAALEKAGFRKVRQKGSHIRSSGEICL